MRRCRVDALGGRETDAEGLIASVEALTDVKPRIYCMKNYAITLCNREHPDGLARYAELADAIEKWLEETGR